MVSKVEEIKLAIEPHSLEILNRVNQILSGKGIKAYLVGGVVRDSILGRTTADIDIAVAADVLEIIPEIAREIGGKYVLLDEENKVCRIVLAKGSLDIDFSTLRGDIEKDLALRDFSINAMAIDLDELAEGKLSLIDPFNGRSDLQQKLLRVVGDTSLQSDPVRLLRAVRIAAELGFAIESETESLIIQYCRLVADVPGERVREELLRLLAVPNSGQFLLYLDKLWLVTAVIPELAQAKGVEQPKEHFWDVFNHSLRTPIAVDFLLRRGDWQALNERTAKKALGIVPWSEVLEEHFEKPVSHGSNRRTLLKLAALLHDIAKPATKTFEPSGRMRFFEHSRQGAGIVTQILERLRFSAKEIKLVETMVREHMRPTQVTQVELPTRRAVYRYFRDTGDAAIDTLYLSLADHMAARGPELKMAGWQEHVKIVKYILDICFEPQMTAPPRLIDGNDLMREFGLKPGRSVGELLEAVREAHAAGEVSSREEALALVRKKLSKIEQD